MADSEAQIRYRKLLSTIGRAGLHAIMPNDFEYYMVALELVDSSPLERTIDYLSFPVMPNNITHSIPQITNIKKTMGGVTALSTTTFIPSDITLSGNFGRKLRFLIGSTDLLNISALKFGTQSGVFTKDTINALVKIKKAIFDPKIKTGYGVTKILQAICDKSNALDDNNQPMKLYFYNPSLGESFLVKVVNLTLSQAKESSNMIWNYSLQLKTLAPLDQIRKNNELSLGKAMAFDVLQKGVNQVLSNITHNQESNIFF